MSRRARGWVVLGALAVSLTVNTAFAVAVQSSPRVEAARFARDLRAATTSAGVAEVVLELLDSLGVSVCDATGRAVGQHRSSDPGACVYEIEVRAVSRAFLRGTLMPLDTLAADWAREGLTCPGSQPCDGAAAEAMLREMRRQAEVTPNNWQGFLIRLVDDLGRRSDRPFSLLSLGDKSCLSGAKAPGAAPGGSPPEDPAGEALGAMFGDIARQAEEDGDDDIATLFRALQSGGNLDQMMAALARGDTSVLMQLMGEPEPEEQEWYGVERVGVSAGEEDDIAEGFAMGMWGSMDQSGPAAGPQIRSQANRLTRELAQQDIDRRQNELMEYSLQVREGLGPDDLGAEGRIDVGVDEACRALEVEQARANYQFADWHAQVQEHIWQDPPEDESWKTERRGVLAGGADETTSCINLDAVQVLLLQIELLDMAHPVYVEGGM